MKKTTFLLIIISYLTINYSLDLEAHSFESSDIILQRNIDEILYNYRTIEENPDFQKPNILWNDIIYKYSQPLVSQTIIEHLIDSTKISGASMTKSAHFAWALYDSKEIIGYERIGAWMGSLCPKVKNTDLLDQIPSTTKWIHFYHTRNQSEFIIDAGCRWAAFYPVLDSIGYEWLNFFQGFYTITELSEYSKVPRVQLALFCLALKQWDVIEFYEKGNSGILIDFPDEIGHIYGLGYFFIGE